MTAIPQFHILEILARAVWLTRQSYSAAETLAVAWVLCNRVCGSDANTLADVPGATCDLDKTLHVCSSVLSDIGVAPSTLQRNALSCRDHGFCRAYGYVCLVCEGAISDPTKGATLLHRHDQVPDWSNGKQPTALIGRLLFFREEPQRAPVRFSEIVHVEFR